MHGSESQRAGTTRWLLIGGGCFFLALTALFGWSTWRSHAAFRAYSDATLHDAANPPRWQRETLSPEDCVSEAMVWMRSCPGIGSWCEAAMSEPMKQCLVSQDRTAYCREFGETMLSTRFGYASCKERYEAISETYERRAAKKSCAAAQRVIAQYCHPELTLAPAAEPS